MAELLETDDPVQLCYQIAYSIMDSTIITAINFEAQMKYHIKNSINAVLKYCNLSAIATDDYLNAITNLAIVYYNNQKVILNNDTNDKIASKTQGSRSMSFRDSAVQINSSTGIPDFIKAMLPLPKIKVTG